MTDSASRLPARPSLEQLHKQARELLNQYREGDIAARKRIRASIPKLAGRYAEDSDAQRVSLADAQFVLAREYGFENWAALKHHIEALPHPKLEALSHLPELRRFQMCWQSGVSDAGIANLRFCENLESVHLLGTPTGDGAIKALVGKPSLRRFKTGREVTDAALPFLQQFPVFKTWQGGEVEYSLMSPDAEPNHLLLDGPFTNKGFASIAGLDGLFALTFFWHVSNLTAEGLKFLTSLPNLGFLGCQDKLCNDEAMRHIGALPRLRMLMGQGAVAGDDGFGALSRSQTIEYIWGRDCPNLGGRGFAALARMPSLKVVSCKNVHDASSTNVRESAMRAWRCSAICLGFARSRSEARPK